MDTETRQGRASALDEFAKAGALATTTAAAGAVSAASHDLIHGAQKVAVYRDEGRVLERLRVLAAAAGADWYYRYPVRNRRENRTDWIEGPSIKLANDLARIYGNCEVDCRVQDFGDGWIFYARFIDLETGYSLTRPFQARKTTGKIGGDDDGRRLDIAFAIAASKAIRNCVVNALQTFADFAFEEAKNALVERIGQNLEKYRTQTVERVSAHVDIARVEAVIGRPRKDWLAPDIARVISMMKAVTDGMATIDEQFPPLEKQQSQSTSAASLDAFANADGETGPEKGASAANDAPPSTSTESDSLPLGDAPDPEAASDSTSPSPESLAADIFETIQRRMKAAPSPEAVHEIWEQMELDAYFEGDKKGRDKAWKIASARLAELKK